MTTMLEPEQISMRSDARGPTKRTSAPLGATRGHDGVNFSVFSKDATGVELLLFDHVDEQHPARAIRLDPAAHRTYHYWHVFVPGVKAGQLYGYRVEGPWEPHQAYSSRRDPLGPINEFRDMAKALHRAGIEVILDVVFNHTAEGDERGPALCFRGLDNATYYILEQDRSRYANCTAGRSDGVPSWIPNCA
jgi:pullulanase/glycogen debranching enzyme